MSTIVYELRIEKEYGHIVEASIFAVDADGQMRYVRTETFGPFDSTLDVARWAWKYIALDSEASPA